jgi:DNA-binding NarL/FixJ family response regulator
MKPSAPPKKAAAPAVPARRRILIVDDHPFMRAGLAQLINGQPDLVVCGEEGSPAEALRALATTDADLLLTDINMPGRSGTEFIKDVRAQRPGLPILAISMHNEAFYAERVLRAGAQGYIMKEAGGDSLLVAIRQVLGGQVYVSARMSAEILGALAARRPRGSSSPVGTLSDREFEVFKLVGHGHGAKEIAERLRLSPKTVDVHRARIKEKLGLADMPALIRHAVRWVETQDGGS